MFLLCRNETNGLLEKMEDVPGPFFNNLQTIYFINCAASDVRGFVHIFHSCAHLKINICKGRP